MGVLLKDQRVYVKIISSRVDNVGLNIIKSPTISANMSCFSIFATVN